MTNILTIKGRALLAAIDAGLLPKVPDGWDDEPFQRFWQLFCKELGYDPDERRKESAQEASKPFEDGAKMLNKQRPGHGQYYGQENKPYLKLVLRALFGLALFLLGGLFFKLL